MPVETPESLDKECQDHKATRRPEIETKARQVPRRRWRVGASTGRGRKSGVPRAGDWWVGCAWCFVGRIVRACYAIGPRRSGPETAESADEVLRVPAGRFGVLPTRSKAALMEGSHN